jgi:CoA:oxalate CoA-transferase
VNRFDEALADEQVLARNMVVELRTPTACRTRGPGNPIKLSRTDEESFSPAPLLGEHTDACSATCSATVREQIATLREEGAVA